MGSTSELPGLAARLTAEREADRPLPHLPALDGLRGIALLGVLLFHGGFTWISGGYLPLTAFFVLSGFLITSLLLIEWSRFGRIDLRGFWSRRFRRLAPASILGVVLIGVTLTIDGGIRPPGLRGDLISVLTWTANWRFILSDREYVDLFGDPSPFQHFWSLAVEEQFYVFMPLAVVIALSVRRGRRWPLTLGTLALIAASTVTMRALHTPGDPPMRAYFGTDARAAELLVGVLLALMMIRDGRLRTVTGTAGRVVDIAAIAALSAMVTTWFLVDEFDDRLYDGGILAVALLAAVVVIASTRIGSPVERVLAWRPFVALGTISYGVYLFHWPIFLLVDERVGLDGGPLFALRMGVTVPLAIASYQLVERPIRAGGFPDRLGALSWANGTVAAAAIVLALSSTLATEPTVTLRAPFTTVALPPLDESGPDDPPDSESVDAGDGNMVASDQGAENELRDDRGSGVQTIDPLEEATDTDDVNAAAPVRVMVVGDSLAQNLATGLIANEAATGIQVHDASVPGCPIVHSKRIRHGSGAVIDFPAGCVDVLDSWGEHIERFRPDVVVVQGGVGELPDSTTEHDPAFRAVGDVTYDAFVLAELQERVDVLRRRDATIVWTNAPCVDASRHYAGLPPATLHARLARFNRIVGDDLAATRPIIVADLHRRLCPTGTFEPDVEGVVAGRPDGVHLADVAAANLAREWLIPMILERVAR